MKNLLYLVVGFVSAMVLCVFLYHKEDTVKPQWVPPPAPQVLPPTPPKVEPVQPQPLPKKRIAKLLIITAPNCSWCDKLKADWKDGYPVPHEYRMNSQEIANNWNIRGTPTIIGLNEQGLEMDRKLGYLPKEELVEWLSTNVRN